MATLNEQVRELESQLSLNQQASNIRYILDAYDIISKSFLTVDNSLKTILKFYQVLQDLPEDTTKKMVFSDELKEAAKKALFSLKTFNDRWRQEKHEARQGNDLAVATESLKSILSSCTKEIKTCWKSWVRSLEKTVRIEKIRFQSQRNIPGQEGIILNFSENQRRFNDLIKSLPENTGIIKELIQIRGEMIELKSKMKFDLPDEVNEFFKELDASKSNVSLAILTAEVLEWLRDNDMLDEYVVSRKGKY